MLEKIVSGGQTGADRAALDAAMALTFPVGGYCPKGRKAEDGPIDKKYPLTEVEGGYRQRTLRNVEDSDGTAIFFESNLSGGTAQTRVGCDNVMKPYRLLDIARLDVAASAGELREFVDQHNIRILNVAGPRASGSPRTYAFVWAAMTQLLNDLRARGLA